jgi:chromosome segregation ATPase
MDRFEAYKEKMHARLLQWDAEARLLEARIKEAKADKMLEYQDEMEALKAEIARAKVELNRLSESGEEAWQSIKAGLDEAWDSIADGFRNARSKF